jgi:acetyl-CoA acetyltransferase
VTARFRAQNQVAIVGYAHSQIQRHHDKSLGALAIETGLAAIADAGLDRSQIDGFTTGAHFPNSGGHPPVDGESIITAMWMAEHLGTDVRFYTGFHGVGQISGATILATNALASGAADYVLVHRAMSNPKSGRYNESPMTEAAGSAQWSAPAGNWGAIAQCALGYREYLEKYGASRETTAKLAVEARHHGSKIPWSNWYGKPITEEDYFASRMVADPMCVLDCDIPIDGVGCFVLTTADRARDLPNKPVYVAGFAQSLPTGPDLHAQWTLDDIEQGGDDIGRRLWEHTGLRPEDIDLPQLYDGFSPFIYWWLEGLGYCKRGEAHELVASGGIEADNGGLPIYTGGGAIGNGRMHGVPQMLECYLQLSGRAGDRQRAQARTAIACQAPPQHGGVVAYSAEPL